MAQPQLFLRSVEVIRQHQAPSGAYIASPSFPTYAYAWLRDGSFTAHAMDLVGEHDSAGAFFRWAGRTIAGHAGKVDRVLAARREGRPLADGDFLHTRYTLQGEEASGEWGNHQLDGYGTWLWALEGHLRLTGDRSLLAELAPSVAVTVRYLAALWAEPCYDCWEEHPTEVHTHTLAAVYGGLRAGLSLLPEGAAQPEAPEALRQYLLAHGVRDGHLVKSILPGAEEGARHATPAPVDASLLGAMVPYGLLSPADPVARQTVARIERDLCYPGGGVYRYLADTYYGGGEWVLLAAWLGWYHAQAGDTSRAKKFLAWVEGQADAEGDLPEQVSAHLLAPSYYERWLRRWGPIAKPLLWSHAMYLILHRALAASVEG